MERQTVKCCYFIFFCNKGSIKLNTAKQLQTSLGDVPVTRGGGKDFTMIDFIVLSYKTKRSDQFKTFVLFHKL